MAGRAHTPVIAHSDQGHSGPEPAALALPRRLCRSHGSAIAAVCCQSWWRSRGRQFLLALQAAFDHPLAVAEHDAAPAVTFI